MLEDELFLEERYLSNINSDLDIDSAATANWELINLSINLSHLMNKSDIVLMRYLIAAAVVCKKLRFYSYSSYPHYLLADAEIDFWSAQLSDCHSVNSGLDVDSAATANRESINLPINLSHLMNELDIILMRYLIAAAVVCKGLRSYSCPPCPHHLLAGTEIDSWSCLTIRLPHYIAYGILDPSCKDQAICLEIILYPDYLISFLYLLSAQSILLPVLHLHHLVHFASS